MRSGARADGRVLSVREAGDPEGLPLLYMAGTPGSSMLYEPHIQDAESRGIRLISYDRPGYGRSSRGESRRVVDCAADVAAVCDALGLERCFVAGISGGGPHALAAAALATGADRGGCRAGERRALRRRRAGLLCRYG